MATTFATNSVHTLALFVQATGGIVFDPGNTRIRLNFTDAGGVVRGQTSVAVTTN